MKYLICFSILMMCGCENSQNVKVIGHTRSRTNVRRMHDDEAKVTCWILSSESISCLHDLPDGGQ